MTTLQASSDASWILPALFGVIVGLLSIALKIIWDEVAHLRDRVHSHKCAILKTDAKVESVVEDVTQIKQEMSGWPKD